jgi:putative transposase
MNGNQPHRKLIKHFHEPGHFHEFTFSCYLRQPLLTNDSWQQQLSRSIDQANREQSFQLVAFVYMPEHVHLLVYPTLPEPDIGLYLARVKQPFSKQIKQLLEQVRSPLLQKLTVRERPGKFCFRFWQEGPGFDRNLFTADAIQASIDYIHHNPESHGGFAIGPLTGSGPVLGTTYWSPQNSKTPTCHSSTACPLVPWTKLVSYADGSEPARVPLALPVLPSST